MKIICNREKMLHAFQTVAAIAPARSPKAILQNVKLEVTKDVATLMATDLEVGIRYEVTGIEVDVPGAAVLPVGRFGSILRESSDATFRIEAGSDGTTNPRRTQSIQAPLGKPARLSRPSPSSAKRATTKSPRGSSASLSAARSSRPITRAAATPSAA